MISVSGTLLAGNVSENRQSQTISQAICPIALATNCRLVSDFLAESIEIAMTFGFGVLAAAREADDTTIIQQFTGFDSASRTARRCAEDLRTLHEARGGQ